jgi:hypothetical protein
VGVILRAYPRTRGLTHEWVVLAGALRTIRVRHASLLLPGELDRLAALQARAEAVATR